MQLGCQPFTYGFYCSQRCKCSTETSESCDSKTGKCKCKPGFHGDQCEMSMKKKMLLFVINMNFFDYHKVCPSGQWGNQCLNKCDCNRNSCNPRTGICECSAGRTGIRCEQGIDRKRKVSNIMKW